MSRGTDTPERTIGQRYALERELGRGGMGTVYLARDLKHDRRVAIKFLGGAGAGAGGAARFLAEIRIAARLNHPHILQVHDSGTADDELFYVMPHVEGASLRERLNRDRRMTVPDALRTACHVADALAYAHAHGVIHRDIKPENILLDRQDHAYVADFGLARALSSVASSRLTASGLTVGSPPYMSPEQAAGDEDLDGRSDLYSLGCVFFEMLAGQPPFSGGRAQNVLRQHLTEPPPSLRSRRADVPPELERILQRLLAKDPDDRYATADELRNDLDGLLSTAGNERRTAGPATAGRRRRILATFTAAAAAGLVLLGVWSVVGAPSRLLPGTAAVDSTRYAVLPLYGAQAAHHLMLQEALAHWEDITIVDHLRVADAMARREGSDQLSASEALALAIDMGAGRYVHGSEVSIGSQAVRVTVGLYDASDDGALLRSASAHLTAGDLATADVYSQLADSLLFGRTPIRPGGQSHVGTRSVRALNLYGAGYRALEDWHLSAADSLFFAAVEEDPRFARAGLWLAQVRNWAGQDIDRWQTYAARARNGADRLSPRERDLAVGLDALASGNYPEACEAYASLKARDSMDFAALFGLGECLRRDAVVVADAASPSGWGFRSSLHSAVQNYRMAFESLPSSHFGFRSGSFERVQDLLFTHPNRVRFGSRDGSAPPEFVAAPQLQHDTLAFVPYPWGEAWENAEQDVDAWREAVDRQRRSFSRIARAWSASYPESPDAAYAQSVALEMLNDPSALEWIRRARELEHDPLRGPKLAAKHAWLRLKYGAPDTAEIAAARVLADSILRGAGTSDPALAADLAALAAVFGRAATAARFARTEADGSVPRVVAIPARALLAFAAVGGPVDSIREYELRTQTALRGAIADEGDRMRAYTQVLEQPAMLAFPVGVMEILYSETALNAPLARAQSAWLHGNRAEFDSLMTELRGSQPSELSPEVSYATARLLALSGDTATAVRWLDGLLGNLRYYPPGALDRLPQAGIPGRAMALRAALGRTRPDDSAARSWARAAATLWARAEPPIRAAVPDLRDMAQR